MRRRARLLPKSIYAGLACLVSGLSFSPQARAQTAADSEIAPATSESGGSGESGEMTPQAVDDGATPPPDLPPPPPPKTRSARAAPRIALETPPPPPAIERAGARVHDGLYLRMAAGLGAGTVVLVADGSVRPDYSVSGGGGVLDLWIGGSVTPGLVLGGALTLAAISSDSSQLDGDHSDAAGEGGLGSIGFFVDGFPNPRGGFHFGGALGAARLTANTDEAVTKEFQAGGLSMATWAGYDFWVGREWSLGGTLRLLGAFARHEKAGLKMQGSFGELSLMFTALYN